MSRRDTIIIAVLVNAALLMILFATAVRSDKNEIRPEKKSRARAEIAATAASKEEDLLDKYVTSLPTLETQEEPLTFTEEIELAFSPPTPIEEKKPPESEKPASSYVDVTVKKGDYLEKIAHANNTTVSAIMQANRLTSTQLKIGQILKVPIVEGAVKKPAASESTAQGEYYIVKEGDNPWLIATRNKLKLEELLRLNGLDEQKAKRLRPGDRLRIR